LKTKLKKLLVPALLALLAAALLVPQVAAATTLNVTWTVSGRATSATTGAGKIASKEMGDATFTITYKNGLEYGVANFAGGKIKWKGKSQYKGSESLGHWTVTGGTGKYAGATGGGTGKGPKAGPWTYTGKITY
jgi:hypothetical protein